DRFDDLAVGTVVEPMRCGKISANESDQCGVVLASPASACDAHRALIRAESVRAGEQIEATVLRQQFEWRAKERRIVLARDQLAVSIRGAASAHEIDVGFGKRVAGDK